LPIDEHKENIQRTIALQRVTFIRGETGCGKSTRVPVFVREMHLQDASCHRKPRILMTQPRRMACKTLAQRIAVLLGEEGPGRSVGYRIGGSARDSDKTEILLCTTGHLLESSVQNPARLKQFTHIILDEVHERSIDADFASLILRLFALVADFKLIVMSATLQGNLFAQYFGELNSISGPSERRPGVPAPTVQPIAECITDLVRDLAEGGESILIFLPGIAQITELSEHLAWYIDEDPSYSLYNRHGFDPGITYEVFPLHSTIPQEDQERAVSLPPPPGTAHVILTSNIAESSLTIPNVRVVIDLGLKRQQVYNSSKHSAVLEDVWASQASMEQRAGR
ncbi:unnamed protein product, partial [Amoebophrya sp. A120]